VAPWTEDADALADERRHVQVDHQVEGFVVVGQIGRIRDPEGDPALGIETDLGACRVDHRLGDVNAPHPRLRELARHQKRPLSGAGAQLERALGGGLHVQERGGERREMIHRARARPIVPTGGDAIEVAAQRPADRRPGPGRPDDEPVQGPPDDPDTGLRWAARGRHQEPSVGSRRIVPMPTSSRSASAFV
jgi:hypothetical protein